MKTMTPVIEILREARYSVDFGRADLDPDGNGACADWWNEIVRVKSADTGFGALVLSILENGWDKNSTIGWDREEGYINEGHHRLVAAILLGLDEVPTTTYGTGSGNICAHDCNCNGEDWREGSFLGDLDVDEIGRVG